MTGAGNDGANLLIILGRCTAKQVAAGSGGIGPAVPLQQGTFDRGWVFGCSDSFKVKEAFTMGIAGA